MIRGLTQGERKLATAVFGKAVELDRVQIWSPPLPYRLFNRAFVPGRWFWRDWIVWPRATEDFSNEALNLQATLIHELVHVWQAQQGVNLLFAKIRAGDSVKSYAYPLENCVWAGLNIEQQAMVVEHAFRLSQGGTAPAVRAFYQHVAPFACCLEDQA